MLTTAVGIVDRAANEEVFLVVKSRDGASMATAAKGDDAQQGTLRLPADAKQSLTDGLTDVLEKLSALAQQVYDCEVDETAECPPELASAVDDLADDLDDLADEFTPKATGAEMKSKRDVRKARKPFPGAAPPFGKDKDPADMGQAGAVAKGPGDGPPIGSPPGQGAGPEVPRDPPGEGPGGATGPVNPRDTATNPDVVMKSGRKMAQERLAVLHKAFHDHAAGIAQMGKAMVCMKAGHNGVEQVLKEVYNGPGYLQPPGPAANDQPPSPKPPPAEP
jgi:hypothetical protein